MMRAQQGINRRPLKFLARLGQKLWYYIIIWAYRKGYQPLIGKREILFSGERECETRWRNIEETLSSFNIKNLLDIGCGEGYYVIHAAQDLNCYATGIEADYTRFCIAQAQIGYYDVAHAAVMHKEVSLESIDNLPIFDAILFLSVAHHIMYSFGVDYCQEFMKHLRMHIKKVLVFEMGQSDETQAKWAKSLPSMGKDPHEWIKGFLVSCGYSRVSKVGTAKSFFGDRSRAIFVAIPH